MITFTPDQLALIERPLNDKVFLEGPIGCGKTTVGVERMLFLMANGVPGSSILLLVPQRALAGIYLNALKHPGVAAGGLVAVMTIAGLARRMVDLFWPLVAEPAGFGKPYEPPIFLSLETAQYHLARLVKPLLEQGLFSSVTIDRNRLYSQILDNLNKSAVVGFPYTEIGKRLISAWVGQSSQSRIYEDAQRCATVFREYCLAHNLLDFSLQIEVFNHYLWKAPSCQNYLLETYQHILADNIEEDVPITHDLLREWLPHLSSAFFIYDQMGGYRIFMGADAQSAYALKKHCNHQASLTSSLVACEEIKALNLLLSDIIQPTKITSTTIPAPANKQENLGQARLCLEVEHHRFFPQTMDWVSERVAFLVNEEGIPPGEIAILAPFLSDALRFALVNRLEKHRISLYSHRPSRSLREEPATKCMLTLAMLAYPEWGLPPNRFDLVYALLQALEGIDLVRAQLLVEIVYHPKGGTPILSSFDVIEPAIQERITYRIGEQYEKLRLWLMETQQAPPEEFDFFLCRLFGEVLSQAGYGFHGDFAAGQVVSNLVDSVKNFRQAVGNSLVEVGKSLGKEYILMVVEGVIAAQYLRSWQAKPEGAVFLAPAHTFLMSNRPVEVQFWLDIGSHGWAQRLYQPLTHPYVLSRRWLQNKLWEDQDEVRTAQEALHRLVQGLLLRCRHKVYLGLSELSELGYEERGPLLRAFQRALQRLPRQGENSDA